MNNENDKIIVIVPTYNERENISLLTLAIFDALPSAHILFVDDGSPDGTGELALHLSSKDPRISIIQRDRKLGLGKAYLVGFRYALARDYHYIVQMDADFSHDPKYLPKMIEVAKERADLVVGSRYVPRGGTQNWGLLRKCISRGGSFYARTILRADFKDFTSGYKCFRRRVLETLDLSCVHSEGYAFQVEMTYRAHREGFNIEEIPITFVERRVGQSKMSRAIMLEAMWMVWALRFDWTFHRHH